MTLAILDLPKPPSAREMMEQALQPHILIGMPHLTPQGLSETWLMKELGHRHWLTLARSMDMDNADFRTADGLEAYAAICATALRHARLDRVHANDVLTIRSLLSPVSRTQTSSIHRIFAGALPICEVELISTFVHRLTEGDNHSIARVLLPGKSPTAYGPNRLAKTAADLRAGRHETIHDNSDKAIVTSVDFRASGSQEFNGAGLFYFAEFQALMERAYEQTNKAEAARSKITHREVFFFANVQENEMVRVEINAAPGAGPISCRICRQDGKMIAYARCFRTAL